MKRTLLFGAALLFAFATSAATAAETCAENPFGDNVPDWEHPAGDCSDTSKGGTISGKLNAIFGKDEPARGKEENPAHGHGTEATNTHDAHDHHSDHAQKVMGKGEGQSDYTLLQVMHDLTASLSRLQFGIMTNNRLMIKEGAAGIANHPAPKGGLKPYLKKNAEDIKDVIPVMDKRVHQTSVKITEVADTAPMEDIQSMYNTVAESCVGCHNMFRD